MKKIIYTSICALSVACSYQSPEAAAIAPPAAAAGNEYEPAGKEAALEQLGFIDVATLDEGIKVHLVYATPYNFMGKALYKDIRRAYLQPAASLRANWKTGCCCEK